LAGSGPKVTLVGKGVCFDTGGYDLKPASGMATMKKDMGGGATVLAIAAMVMGAKLKLRLRVLIPAVENSVSGDAFRPGDVFKSRKGLTVEIGNTDAEGRLILADALALADEEAPELLLDIATLTGAARVATGMELPPFFTDDEALAADLSRLAMAAHDPVWRLPLWRGYDFSLGSRVADLGPRAQDFPAGTHPFPFQWVRRRPELMFNVTTIIRQFTDDFERNGGKIVRREFASPSEFASLPQPVILHCTGYAARKLFGDESLVPVRGQISWLPAQPEANYGLYIGNLGILSRRDGIVVQFNGKGDDAGWNDDSEQPDPAEAELGIRRIQDLYARRKHA
jgi:hypothetical protein